MTQPDLPLAEQVADLTPELQATHRRMLVRQRQDCSVSRWWFAQMRKSVDAAPEPDKKEIKP